MSSTNTTDHGHHGNNNNNNNDAATATTTTTTTTTTKTVVIAGATGYLGRHLVAEYSSGTRQETAPAPTTKWHVIAIVRNAETAHGMFPSTVQIVQAQVTQPETLHGIMDQADLVISAVGITRQRDGLTYRDVDYQANLNLLQCAIQANVPHFAYIHVLHGETMAHLPAIQAKQDFVNALQQAVTNQQLSHATIVAPSGFFSDMKDFLDMARNGRAYLFGNGQQQDQQYTLNPIHGADLARVTAHAIEARHTRIHVGGPDIFTHAQLATLAFETLHKPVRITYVWDWIRTTLIHVLPWITPLSVYGPAQFFLTVMGRHMVGDDCRLYMGKDDNDGCVHHLKDYFEELVQQDKEQD